MKGAGQMFVVSMKLSTLKVVSVLAVIAVIITVVAVWPRGEVQASTVTTKQVTGISTNEKRVGFIQSYGWKVDSTPVEVVEITIPQTFNEVYKNYNSLQKKQGFDLSNYKGKRCKRWTYRVTNYPGIKDEVRANLLVYNDRVIGGDIATVALNGFMHGFTPPQDTDNTQDVTPASANIVSGIADVTLQSAIVG
ncbi:MAG: DUF4830 domain-containing protein [Clostridia bacterium]|nr:DUF4830 domain-containing protein [Clostridia bacterium]